MVGAGDGLSVGVSVGGESVIVGLGEKATVSSTLVLTGRLVPASAD
jgi:hypothetical protein